MIRAAVQGFAFANLVYLRVWAEMLNRDPGYVFYHIHLPYPAEFLALLANVSALGLATALVIRISSRLPKLVRAGLLLLGSALILSALRATFYRSEHVGPALAYSAGGAFLAAVFICALKWTGQTERIARYLMLAASPVLLVTFSQAIRFTLFPLQQPAEHQLAAFQGTAPPRRVVWIIFDEWDYRLSFVDRPASVSMPAVDQLGRDSFFAGAALPPARDTRFSMPALVHGRLLPTMQLGSDPNLFSRVRSNGWNAGVVGWYLPYCRELAGELSTCYWDQLHDLSNAGGTAFAAALQYQTRSLFETNRRSLFGQTTVARRHADQYMDLLQHACVSIGDPRLALTLVHMNIPHASFFYDARTRGFDANLRIATGYSSALVLVDLTLGKLLDSLRESGLADKTALVVSSDHWLRNSVQVDGKEDHRVPFIVHLPDGGPGVRYEKEFPTLITQELILELLRNRIRTQADVAQWIAERTGPLPSGADGQ